MPIPPHETFFLLRHGQTAAIGNWLAGTAAGMPLNDAGRVQVQRLASQLRDVALAAVISSPLEVSLASTSVVGLDGWMPIERQVNGDSVRAND